MSIPCDKLYKDFNVWGRGEGENEAALRRRNSITFQGSIYAHQLRVPIGACVRDLEIIASAGEPADMLSAIEFLPL